MCTLAYNCKKSIYLRGYRSKHYTEAMLFLLFPRMSCLQEREKRSLALVLRSNALRMIVFLIFDG